MNETLRDVASFVSNDWRTLVIDLLLGCVVLAVVCGWSWKLALITFCVLSYVAGTFIVLGIALLIGFKVKEKLDAFVGRD